MFNTNGKQQINAFLAAMRRLADPHRGIMADGRTCVVITGGRALHAHDIWRFARAADAADADLIHLEFEPGSEAAGPVAIRLALIRGGQVYTETNCALWADDAGNAFIYSRKRGATGLASFHPDGMNFHFGVAPRSISAGLGRGMERLRQLAAEELARPLSER